MHPWLDGRLMRVRLGPGLGQRRVRGSRDTGRDQGFSKGHPEGLWADFMFKIVPSVALAHTGSGESKLF